MEHGGTFVEGGVDGRAEFEGCAPMPVAVEHRGIDVDGGVVCHGLLQFTGQDRPAVSRNNRQLQCPAWPQHPQDNSPGKLLKRKSQFQIKIIYKHNKASTAKQAIASTAVLFQA